jgi:cytochrome c peroxidase
MANFFSRTGILLALVSFVFIVSCKQADPSSAPNDMVSGGGNDPVSPIPTDFPPMIIPSDNPMTDAKILLGRHLFYDKNLSVDRSTACASCHITNEAFSDMGNKVSMGFRRQMGDRNAMALANIAYNTNFIWDARFKSLEEHAIGPILHPKEMGNANGKVRDVDTTNPYGGTPTGNDTLFLFQRMRGLGDSSNVDGFVRLATYNKLFKDAFGDTVISLDRIAKAIASFERTFISHDSPFDRYNRGDKNAISDAAKRGFALFIDNSKTNCISCHSGPNFTDNKLHSNGLYYEYPDKGRFVVTKDPKDDGVFKTPTLRNVGLTAPYMHDGSKTTLEDVIKHYAHGGQHNVNQDPLIKPLDLSDNNIRDLADFLLSLSDTKFTTNPGYSNPWNK